MSSLTDSPFADRLNTNYIPSDSEIVEIRTLLMDPTDELARVEARIEEMEIVLSQLKELRASLKTPIDAHRTLISPLRRIPQDVLLAIFSSCLPSEHNALIDPAEAPLLLGRICRHWRDVTYTTPMLWSSIHIPCLDYLHAPPNMISGLERTVEAWLERSSACPLSVSVFDDINYPSNGVEKHPLILQLLPISRRLSHLTLVGDAELLRPILRLGSESLPVLKRIWIQATRHQIFGDDADHTNALQIPTLEDVTLQITSDADPLALPLKWSQLTRIRLECHLVWREWHRPAAGGLDIGGAFEVLRRCPYLMHCEIRVTRPSKDGSTLDTSPITLPHLRTLVLSGSYFQFQSWTSHLVVPKLWALRLGEVATEGPAIRSSATRDGSLSADIDTDRFTSSGLHELLRSFPTISHLRLSSSNLQQLLPDDVFIDLLRDLCPIMTNITLLGPSAGLSDAAVLAFVKARMTLPTPLQQFWARFGRARDLDIVLEVQSFISDGLQVSIEYFPGFPQWEFRPHNGLDVLSSLY
ncbi:hypothetical protein DFH08DRAFT_1073427 [Mycena albidolilacea]|uniref:F-box domain-containing protein n=1 Tax=Mycena albidolilacea TaxID=1033008 RepID=A0AAD7AQ91_9AGAR|nr:hypothetical protein DFH08DRAFT_1073427 [Mycena albidolilacea]